MRRGSANAGPTCLSADETEQQYRRQKALAAEKREHAAKHARPVVRCAHVYMDKKFFRGHVWLLYNETSMCRSLDKVFAQENKLTGR